MGDHEVNHELHNRMNDEINDEIFKGSKRTLWVFFASLQNRINGEEQTLYSSNKCLIWTSEEQVRNDP